MDIDQVVIESARRATLARTTLADRPDPDEILVESLCSFISAGTELAIYTASDPAVHEPNGWCRYPFRPGYANVGVVKAAGARVRRVRPGDRVFTCGPHASHFLYRPEEKLCLRVPDGLSSDVAAASRMAAVAASAAVGLERPIFNPVVLVIGLGLVGNYAAQIFQALGAAVVGMDPVPERRALARTCGVARTAPGGDAEAMREQLRSFDLASDRMDGCADIVVEASGRTVLARQALEVAAGGGTVVLLGSPRAPLSGDLLALLRCISQRNLVVRGAHEWSLPLYTPVLCMDKPNWPMPFPSIEAKQRMLFQWLLDGRLTAEPLISHRLPPEAMASAYEGLLDEPGRFTGVLLDWQTKVPAALAPSHIA